MIARLLLYFLTPAIILLYYFDISNYRSIQWNTIKISILPIIMCIFAGYVTISGDVHRLTWRLPKDYEGSSIFAIYNKIWWDTSVSKVPDILGEHAFYQKEDIVDNVDAYTLCNFPIDSIHVDIHERWHRKYGKQRDLNAIDAVIHVKTQNVKTVYSNLLKQLTGILGPPEMTSPDRAYWPNGKYSLTKKDDSIVFSKNLSLP